MGFPNKRELEHTSSSHSLGIDFKNSMNLYKIFVQQNHILFQLLILLLRQIITYVSEIAFFKKNIKTNHDN